MKELTKGLGSSIAREGLYTLFHYSTYRYLKDTVFNDTFNLQTTFFPSFFAGVVAITVSQPLEVIRNQVSLNKINGSLVDFLGKYTK